MEKNKFEIPKKVMDEIEVSQIPTEILITELFNRNIDPEQIESQYYALGEMVNHEERLSGYPEHLV